MLAVKSKDQSLFGFMKAGLACLINLARTLYRAGRHGKKILSGYVFSYQSITICITIQIKSLFLSSFNQCWVIWTKSHIPIIFRLNIDLRYIPIFVLLSIQSKSKPSQWDVTRSFLLLPPCLLTSENKDYSANVNYNVVIKN